MDFSLALLLAAFAGGLFGAAIGGLPAFIFTGFMVLVGVAMAASGSDFDFLTNVAFGPVFGPHISFAAGAAAAAFAMKRGKLENGRDIAAPLAGVNDPMTLIVGGLFGVGGHVFRQLLVGIGVAGFGHEEKGADGRRRVMGLPEAGKFVGGPAASASGHGKGRERWLKHHA